MPVGHKTRREGLEQGRIARRIPGTDVVHRVDDPASKEVAPEPVHRGFGEVRVFLGSQPRCEGVPAVLSGGDGSVFAIRHLRRHHRVVLGMLDLAALIVVIDHFFGDLFVGVGFSATDEMVAAEGSRLEGHLGKEGAELVILVLGPAFERVIVAFVAVEPNPQKRLGNIFGHLAGISQSPEVIAGRIFKGAALGEHQVAGELVEGTICRKLVADPAAEHPDTLLTQVFGIALEQVCELVGPEFRVRGGSDEAVHQGLPLLGGPGGVGEESPHRLRCRRLPSDVQRDSSDELGVVAQFAGIDLQALQFRVHRPVDEIVLRHRGETESGAVSHDGDLASIVESFVANQHSHLASAQRDYRAALDESHLFIVAAQDGLTGHIARGTIRIGGDH